MVKITNSTDHSNLRSLIQVQQFIDNELETPVDCKADMFMSATVVQENKVHADLVN